MKNYNFTPTKSGCPICYNEDANILWSVNSDQAAQHYISKEADSQRFLKLSSHIKKLWGQETCEVVQCSKCGFCYSYPYIAGDAKFYTLAYERSHYPRWKWEYQLTYDTLKKSRQDFTMLEIGAGDGAFVKKITPELTAKEKVLCTEFSDYGMSQISNYGITCLPQDVRTVDSEKFEAYFNVICMFQVIEHMDRLDALFQKLNFLTQTHADLFISVPNPKHVEFSELNDGLLDMPPNHIGRWNRECFEEIGKRWGWQVEGFDVENTDFISKSILFYKYRFWKKCQQPHTIANRISQIKNQPLNKLMRAAGLGLYILMDLPMLYQLRQADLGLSQWVHLKKK